MLPAKVDAGPFGSGARRPKSAACDSAIPIDVVNALREWRLACPKGALGLVFPNAAGNVENHANIGRRRFQALQKGPRAGHTAGNPKYGPQPGAVYGDDESLSRPDDLGQLRSED